VALQFYLDASALAKRYVAETGTPVVDHLFRQVARDRMACLTLGALEVVSLFVRGKNANRIPLGTFPQVLAAFRNEVFDAADFRKLPVADALVNTAPTIIDKHALNASDAVFLCAALELAAHLRTIGDDLVVVASDLRLLRAAGAEGLATFNPETQNQTDLDALIGP
jgi:predicted nucleic acid-binding protein